ncbi:MAG: hypothetical protein ACYDAI_16870 [Trichloromonadaceae bacterium]
MKVLMMILVALLIPLTACADEKFKQEQQAGRSAAARVFTSAFLVQYTPDLQQAMAALEERLRKLTATSGDLVLNKKDLKLFIESTDPESKVVADLRKQKNAPLVRWEARGNFDHGKGGLELNLSQAFGHSTKLALRGLLTQEFFEPIDPQYELTAKVIHRF